jgi:hypothetical protein
MDWFKKLTGFRETAYDDTRARLEVDGRQLQSLINGKSYGIGELDLVHCKPCTAIWAAVLNTRRGASNIVLLTLLGGSAFGNREDWILAAMRRALEMTSGFDIDVRRRDEPAAGLAGERLQRPLDIGGTLHRQSHRLLPQRQRCGLGRLDEIQPTT